MPSGTAARLKVKCKRYLPLLAGAILALAVPLQSVDADARVPIPTLDSQPMPTEMPMTTADLLVLVTSLREENQRLRQMLQQEWENRRTHENHDRQRSITVFIPPAY